MPRTQFNIRLDAMADLNLPNPIIFGPNRPNLRVRYEGGTQYLYSNSNFNLYIGENNLTEKGTYTVGNLPWHRRGPGFVYKERMELPECPAGYYDNEGRGLPCPMLVESSEQFDDSSKPPLTLARVKLRLRPELYQCRMLSALLNCISTPAEKRFAEMYYNWAIAGVEPVYTQEGELAYESDLGQKYAGFIQKWHEQQLNLDPFRRHPGTVSLSILRSLKAPALIPQVWLNYTYDPKRSPDEERRHLRYIPRRVDFIFIKDQQLHVVEIDDPSHYAKYDKTNRKYEVDEEQYTQNLQADRALKLQGFQIHRISNLEILRTTDMELIDLIPDALFIEL